MQCLKKKLRDINYRLRYLKLHKKPTQHYLEHYFETPKLESKERTVVTFTTLPDRIDHLSAMINSLLDQTRRPDAIQLCIPEISKRKNTPYIVPQYILDNPAIKIIKAEQDYGPATKLIPSLLLEKNNSDTKLIIVDDDEIYPPYHLEFLNHWANLLPEAAIGGAGCLIPNSLCPSKVLDDKSVIGQSLRLTADRLNYLTRVDILFGYASYVVRPKYFSQELLNYASAPKSAFFEDDVWFSGNLARNNIERYIFPCFGQRFSPASSRKTRHTGALCIEENCNHTNMDNLYEFFKQHW